MNKVNRVMLMIIAMVMIMIAAVGIDKVYDLYQANKWEKERVEVYEKARADIEEMQTTIQTLSKDPDALISYIEENELNYVEEPDFSEGWAESGLWEANGDSENAVSGEEDKPGSISGNGSGTENGLPGSDVSGNGTGAESGMSENGQSGGMSENGQSGSVSGNNASGGSISGNGSVSGNSMSGSSISGNGVSGNGSVSGNTISGGSMSGSGSVSGNGSQKRKLCASYEETLKRNALDEKAIRNSQVDFSDVKIACLGDSLTAATNLNEEDDYQSMSYPYQLKEILGAEEVVNLGIGGSSIGRYWDNAFVDRYQEIPKDADLIIVMGGTNDGFCASEKEFGSLSDRKERTFVGDLDELLKGLKEDYPDARIVLATPLPNVLHDMLRRERDYLLPQWTYADAMLQLAEEYEIPVIDLYHSNLLDTHDAAVIHNFMPDGVHGNKEGYRILAEHVAARLIKIYEEQEEE